MIHEDDIRPYSRWRHAADGYTVTVLAVATGVGTDIENRRFCTYVKSDGTPQTRDMAGFCNGRFVQAERYGTPANPDDVPEGWVSLPLSSARYWILEDWAHGSGYSVWLHKGASGQPSLGWCVNDMQNTVKQGLLTRQAAFEWATAAIPADARVGQHG